MRNLAEHEAEQAEITAAYENSQPHAVTDNIGALIAESIEHAFVLEQAGDHPPVFVEDIDEDDRSNLRVTLANGQVFIVRIIAGP